MLRDIAVVQNCPGYGVVEGFEPRLQQVLNIE